MNVGKASAGQLLRFAGAFMLNLAVAVFGPAVIESSVWAALPRAGSFTGIEAKEWFLGVTGAALLGFFFSRRWPSRSAAWVWIVPVLFFALGVLAYSGRRTNSVLVDDGFWKHFFAPDCFEKSNCRDYLVFTVPAARAAAYSLAAWLSLRLRTGRVSA
jgi:hypothetical protein